MSSCDLISELGTAQFGDARLTKRISKIAESLSQKPNTSIPAAFDFNGVALGIAGQKR